MIKQFTVLGMSTLIRLLTGFVLFVLIAREWGAGRFGEFMYFFAVAGLLVQVCEYGFSQQILREIGRDPDTTRQRMGVYFATKLWLTMFAWIFAGIFALVTGLRADGAATLGLLLLAATLMSYSDFLMACFRALGHYGKEASVTLEGNVAYFGLALAAVLFGAEGTGVAAAMVLGRIVHLLATVVEFRRHVPGSIKVDVRFGAVWPVMRGGGAYGLDVGVATAFANLDTVLLAILLGYESVGVYQAGARFYQGASLLPSIFAGIFLPRMARAAEDPVEFGLLARNLYWSTLAIAFAVCGVFVIGAEGQAWIYPEPSLQDVGALMPWFGLLVLIRFIAASQGITVTALGGQTVRAKLFLVALALMVASAFPFVEAFGLTGMILAISVAYAFLSIGFWVWVERQGVRTRPSLGVAVFASILAATLILKLKS
ncbi:oligosaccharide flippase family protein [Denitromonas iodatirespirans]|uniref:Oligosaccharide flippase family protein n=1 Tax=Denitromonas iodatirespirans TaxID=2795389 RepID=A0A944DQH9_DENI1|nr:oligosaccharide flippase family protein [Denitromonas iodatirespirans]MBT0962764.1 oligosaccharide flippase family protein [Denitromonas iodatirespirans]